MGMSSSIGRSNNAAFFWALRYSRLRKRPPGRHRRHRHHPSLLLFSLPFSCWCCFLSFQRRLCLCVCEYNASDKLLIMNTQALKTFSTPKKRWIKKITINPKPYTHKCSVSYPISHKKKNERMGRLLQNCLLLLLLRLFRWGRNESFCVVVRISSIYPLLW